MKSAIVFRRAVIAAILFVAIITAPAALAAEPAGAEPGWKFEVTPYLWGAGLDGDIAIGRLPAAGVEASFQDIWDVLSFGGMLAFEARHDRWGMALDLFYVDLNDTIPTRDPSVFGDADATVQEQIYTGFVTFRAYKGKTVSVDALLGPRYVRLDNDLELVGGIADGRARSLTVDWWDIDAGARVVAELGKRWRITGLVDVGTGGSDLTWEAVAGAGFSFNKLVSLRFGYRYLDIDYSDDQFTYQVATAGPYVGVGFSF